MAEKVYCFAKVLCIHSYRRGMGSHMWQDFHLLVGTMKKRRGFSLTAYTSICIMKIPIGVYAKGDRYECFGKRRSVVAAQGHDGQKRLGKALVLRYNEGKLHGGRCARAGGKPPKGASFRRVLLVFPRTTFLGVRIWRFPLRNGRAAATISSL